MRAKRPADRPTEKALKQGQSYRKEPWGNGALEPSAPQKGATQLPKSEQKSNSTADAGAVSPKKANALRAKAVALWKKFKRKIVSVGFRGIMTIILVATVAGVGVATVTTSHKLLSENKLRDVWAILFLELERRAGDLSQQLTQNTTATGGTPTVVDVDKSGGFHLLSGPALPATNLKDFGIERFEDLTSWNLLVNVRGDTKSDGAKAALPTYAGKVSAGKGKRRLTLTPFRNRVRLANAGNVAKSSSIYVISRQSRLIYANTSDITEKNVLERLLVQKFISLPAWQGQMDLVDAEGNRFYGFFHEVPGTNLTVFAETSKSAVTSAVTAATRRLIITLLVTMASAIFLLQVPLFFLLRPVSNLVRVAKAVAGGDFDAKPERYGFGEVRSLAEAFSEMTGALKRRDDTITKLMREQVDKLRLENEIALARSIQDSLLPIEPLAAASGLDVSARYQPAGEVAGDWYGYFHDEKRNASIVAIVDISGHGAGASMFTAITASIFEDFRINFTATGEPRNFFINLNRNLRRYGRGKWSATAQLVVYYKGESILEVLNAGHPPTILSALPKDLAEVASGKPDAAAPGFAALSKTASNLLGLSEELTLAVQRVPFPVGRAAVLYTDGLSERRDPAGKVFGVRRIAGTLGKIQRRSPDSLIDGLMNAAEAHARRNVPDDDVCVVVLRSAA